MAVTLARLIRDRRAYVRQLRSLQKTTDSELERFERRIKQILARKMKVPEEEDLAVLAVILREMLSKATDLSRALEGGYPL